MRGIGADLHILSGGGLRKASDFYGRRISAAHLDADEGLFITLDDGTKVRLWDNAQKCCEHRYITCDDDLSKIIGGVLQRIEVKEVPDVETGYGAHEQLFVEVGTDECFITLTTHNEHNGFYSGFGLCIDEASE
jgi:hypothetical protein